MARQSILERTGAPQLWCILDEGVLHRAIGGSKVMRGQHRVVAAVGHVGDGGQGVDRDRERRAARRLPP